MTQPIDYAPAMRRKRRTIYALIVGIALIALAMYRGWLGSASIPIGWVVLIVGAIMANLSLACPACGKRLASINQTACTSCGALLTDKVMILPAQQGPVDPGAAAYMAESRRILRRWARVRRVLRWSPYIVFVVGTVAMIFGPDYSDWKEAVGLGLFAGAVLGGVTWLLLFQIIDNAFGILFLLFRGRCPLCGVWFNPPASFGPASLDLDYSLPQFCASCGGKLA